MREKKPVIFVATANDSDKSLKVSNELKMLTEKLNDAHDQNRILFTPLINASSREIYKRFNKYHNRISIFHYSGHSDGNLFDLENESLEAEQLSKVIAQQDNLNLVFLNSCNNDSQVKLLLEKDINAAIIATSAKINDTKAVQVSELFYEALLGGKTIGEAFESMAAEMAGSEVPLSRISRSIGLPGEEEGSDAFEWGLFANDDEDLSWTIKEKEEEIEEVEFKKDIDLKIDDLNVPLVEKAFEGIKDFITKRKARDYEDYLETEDEQEKNEIFNDLSNTLIDSFPSILSIQIRDLFTEEGKTSGRTRLKELNEAYLTLIRLLLSIALADLWEAMLDMENVISEGEDTFFHAKKGFLIAPKYQKELEEFFTLSLEEQNKFDCVWLVGTISRILNENGVSPFIKEMEEVYLSLEKQDEFYQAYSWMEQYLRRPIEASQLAADEIIELVREGDLKFGLLLYRCAFLCGYQMVTVKEISVSKMPRTPKLQYVYQRSVLKGRDYETMDRNPIIREGDPFSNSSVYLTSDLKEDSKPLNLSPFLIDEQNFRKTPERPIIYFLMHAKEKSLMYMRAEDHAETKEIVPDYDEQEYHQLEILFDQIQSFKTVLGLKQ